MAVASPSRALRSELELARIRIHTLERLVESQQASVLKADNDRLLRQLGVLHSEIRRIESLKDAVQDERDRLQTEADRMRELTLAGERKVRSLQDSLDRMLDRVKRVWPKSGDRPTPDHSDLIYLRNGFKTKAMKQRLKARGRGAVGGPE